MQKSAIPLLADMQRFGFPMGGESSVAVDFVDTSYRTRDVGNVDLLIDDETAWWELQSARLVNNNHPVLAATLRLRSALRAAFEAAIEGHLPDNETINELNYFAESVPTSPQLRVVEEALEVETRWHAEFGGDPNLGAIARDGLSLLIDHNRVQRLRRCANPECQMIFIAENTKRIWCSSNRCGNRARVARHYQKRRRAPGLAGSTQA